MSVDPTTRRDLKLNLDLVMAEIARWPITTTAVLIAFAILTMLYPDETLSPLDGALLLAGWLLALLGMKALMLLALYPRLHKQTFPGSCIVASFIVFVPIFAFYATGFVALRKHVGEEFPLTIMITFLTLSYPLVAIIFAGFLRAMHTILILGRIPDTSGPAIRRIMERSPPSP